MVFNRNIVLFEDFKSNTKDKTKEEQSLIYIKNKK